MLTDNVYNALDASLADADNALAKAYPGESGRRQPVHTVYVPADRYHASTLEEWGATAQEALATRLPDAGALAELLGVDASIAAEVLPRVQAKLAREPIEDLRIDYEDGYGNRSDSDEDSAAIAGGAILRESNRPPFVGIRFKSLEPATRRRGVRTLDLFLAPCSPAPACRTVSSVTLPKVTHVDQVRAFVELCAALEAAHSWPPAPCASRSRSRHPKPCSPPTAAAPWPGWCMPGGRVIGLHYGTYDFSAACGIAAPYQSLEHPIADHAKAVMQLAAAGTGVAISDGSTNIVPVGTDARSILRGACTPGSSAAHSERGYYQGWDLHPLQLVTRYAAYLRLLSRRHARVPAIDFAGYLGPGRWLTTIDGRAGDGPGDGRPARARTALRRARPGRGQRPLRRGTG